MDALEGTTELRRRLEAVVDRSPELVLRTWQTATVGKAKDNVVSFSKTRTLSRSIRPGDLDAKAGNATVTAGGSETHGYARYVEEGTRPHEIRPKVKKALFFGSQRALSERAGSGAILGRRQTGAVNAATVRKYGTLAFQYAKVVKHPGTKPQPYLVPGAKRAVGKAGLANAIIGSWNRAA